MVVSVNMKVALEPPCQAVLHLQTIRGSLTRRPRVCSRRRAPAAHAVISRLLRIVVALALSIPKSCIESLLGKEQDVTSV